MVKQIKLKMSPSTYLIPYDDELYFINLEEDIDNKLIDVSKKDVETFFSKWEINWNSQDFWKPNKYCIFNIDNTKDKLIMDFILKEIEYGIDRDWYDYVTCWRYHEEQEYKEILKKGKKELKTLTNKLKRG
tara:strand:- start:2306 stop:2698 length:393 start_codon:yes stop_codon:yes gene_type:complete